MLPGIELHMKRWMAAAIPTAQGDQIPLLARVIAVADTFVALTTTPVPARTYSGRSTAHHPQSCRQALDPNLSMRSRSLRTR